MKKITLLTFLFGLLLTAQPGPNDGAAFNGIDQFILMPDSDNINTRPVDNRTIETYFKVADGTDRQIFYKEGAQVNTIKFYVENGDLHVGSYKENGGNNKSIWYRTPVNNDTWYHVALVLENATTLRFYLNGVLQASNPNYFQLPVHPGNFEIARTQGPARYPNCNTWGMNGSVEECLGDVTDEDNIQLFFEGRVFLFRIWDDVRTNQEIIDNMNTLISDPTSPEGEDLIAFLDGFTMTYKDDDGDFETEDTQGGALSLKDQLLNDFRVIEEATDLRVISKQNTIPENLILIDLLGKTVKSVSNSNFISKNNVQPGIYILRIEEAGRVTNKKVLIQK
ncbi:MAG: LamG-like jellyroll fold domain-containing protein [Bacteroidota bacterium]